MNEAWKALPTPAVVIDLDTAARNLRAMALQAQACCLSHRPHIKTHRCS